MQNTFRLQMHKLTSVLPYRALCSLLSVCSHITYKTPNQITRSFFKTPPLKTEDPSPDPKAGEFENARELIEVGLTSSWKWDVRCHIWGLMERQNIARSPRPVQNRIPNFENSDTAAIALSELSVFKAAKMIKISPDQSLKKVREIALIQGKHLYVVKPGMKSGLFSLLKPESISKKKLSDVVSIAAMNRLGTPVSLDDKIKIDLIIVGSVAVDLETGGRIGKGEGYSDLEYGILRTIGAITAKTKVITIVHDVQVLKMTNATHLSDYDVPVDVIVTPTRVIYTSPSKPKPTKGIFWNLLNPRQLERIEVLKKLKARVQDVDGLELGPDEDLPPPPFVYFGKKRHLGVECWSCLPLGIVTNIASRCGLREIQSCRLLNKHWLEGTNCLITSWHITRNVVNFHSTFEQTLKKLTMKFESIKKLTADGDVEINFKALAKYCPSLETLDLFGVPIRQGVDFQFIQKLNCLSQLKLSGISIDGNLLSYLSTLEQLNSLDLWRSNVTYKELGVILPHLSNLTNLNLGYTKVKDTLIECFGNLPLLQFLDLGNTSIGSQALRSLSGLVNLKSLFLDHTQVGDAGARYLSPLTKLVDLNLGNTRIGDAGLSHLTTLTNLKDLKLGHTSVSDVGLISFSCLCNLMYVYLDGTNVSDAGVNYLTTIMPHLHLQIRLDTNGIQF
eukprot:g3663.t1